MKSEKGITLISLTIYIIVLTIAIAIIAIISKYFYKNIDTTSKNITPLTEFTRFNSFFSDEVNHKDIKIKKSDVNYIVFSNNIQYTYVKENNGIYRNNVKICRNVEHCYFETSTQNTKKVIKVKMRIKHGEDKEMEYTLK